MEDNYDEITIRKLIDELNYYTKLYDEGKPEISDKEWDDKYFLLQKIEQKTGIYYKDSPTQRVNYQVVNQLNKVEHSHLMLSLDKTKDLEVVRSFLGKKEGIMMAKMDGLTCSLKYIDGRLVSAETRGNGIIGEDILYNALQVKNIPNRIEKGGTWIIDGEIICTYKDFEPFKEEYKNPRNFASGSIRLLDSKESHNRNLTFVAWDLINQTWYAKDEIYLETLSGRLGLLSDIGFTVVPYTLVEENCIDNYEQVVPPSLEEQIEELKQKCTKLGYPIDGVVFKYNNVEEYEAAGRTDHHFKGGIAYKFYDDEYETKLIDIEWTMGRTGQLTPVAIYEDIDIDGTICNRASLHNLSIMEEQLYIPYKGEKIWIAKMNMIIPQVVKKQWIANEYKPGENVFYPPKVCPICGEPTSIHKDNNSKVLYCDNPMCEGKLLNKLDHFCSKKGLDIKGLSKATLDKLIDWGWVENIKDIFTLFTHKEEWVKKQGFGVASVEKILSAIDIASETTLDKIIAAAGIPEIGSRVAKDLASHYDSWTEFRMDTDYTHIDGIGEIMNNNLLNFNYEDMDYIVAAYLDYQPISHNDENAKILDGKVFCITGKVKHFKNRAELQADIESKGGKVVSSMSNKVTHLINNDNTSTSSKNLAAQKANIPIITEEEYLELCNN